MRRLTRQQLQRYARDGVLFPLPALSQEEASDFRKAFERLQQQVKRPLHYVPSPHLFFGWAHRLAAHNSVVEVAEEILGPDVRILNTLLLCKHPGDRSYSSWHQDGTRSKLYEMSAVTVWIALSDATAENGCLRFLPGTQSTQMLPHRETICRDNLLNCGPSVQYVIDESRARDVELRAGEMAVQQNRVIHGSAPNRSDAPRIGYIIRFVAPTDQKSLKRLIPARGAEHHAPAPSADDSESVVTAWTAYCERRFPRYLLRVRGDGSCVK